MSNSGSWPTLPTSEWTETLETLHMYTQVVGKIRMQCGAWLNHSWGVALYVSPTGLRSSLVPYDGAGFELAFDLLDGRLNIVTTRGDTESVPLGTSVADFYQQVMDRMTALGMPVRIHPVPSEVPDAVPFTDDTQHSTYDREHGRALFGALVQAERVFTQFRAGYLGKSSPVHFFWGSFDMAVTRFSGRSAPPHPGGPPNFPLDVAQEAYSHEVTSCGFWPGNRDAPTPIFYAYAYPTPDGFSDARVEPDAAFWLAELGEFALPYDAVATAEDPDGDLMKFLESTHAAAADLAGWDRGSLECSAPRGPDWWRTRSRG